MSNVQRMLWLNSQLFCMRMKVFLGSLFFLMHQYKFGRSWHNIKQQSETPDAIRSTDLALKPKTLIYLATGIDTNRHLWPSTTPFLHRVPQHSEKHHFKMGSLPFPSWFFLPCAVLTRWQDERWQWRWQVRERAQVPFYDTVVGFMPALAQQDVQPEQLPQPCAEES